MGLGFPLAARLPESQMDLHPRAELARRRRGYDGTKIARARQGYLSARYGPALRLHRLDAPAEADPTSRNAGSRPDPYRFRPCRRLGVVRCRAGLRAVGRPGAVPASGPPRHGAAGLRHWLLVVHERLRRLAGGKERDGGRRRFAFSGELLQRGRGSGDLSHAGGVRGGGARRDRGDYAASLGVMTSSVEKNSVRLPVSLDVGVFDWLSVGASAAFVRNETEFVFHFASDSASANAGFSPALDDPAEVSRFLSRLDASVGRIRLVPGRSLRGRPDVHELPGRDGRPVGGRGRFIGHCPSCTGVRWRRWRARRPAWRCGRGWPSSPRRSKPQEQPCPAPCPSPTRPSRRRTCRTSRPSRRTALRGTFPSRGGAPFGCLGDLELRADARWLDKTEPGYTLTAGAGTLVRLPTGTQDDPANFLDMGSGDRQTDVEVRGWLNGSWRDRLGLWTDLRYGVQLPGITERRVFDPGYAMAPAATLARLEWNPGGLLLRRGRAMVQDRRGRHAGGGLPALQQGRGLLRAVGGGPDRGRRLLCRSRAVHGSRLRSGPERPWCLEAAPRQARVVAGIVYSRLGSPRSGFGRGARQEPEDARRRPFEVRAVYRQVVAGSGTSVPVTGSLEAGFRVYVGVWGG